VRAYRGTELHIHLSALEKNYRWLAQVSPEFLCPMVKANGYGHGDVRVAKALEGWGCKTFGVGLVEEGLRLRDFGVQGEILVFGFSGDDAVESLLAHGLTPVISDGQQLEALTRSVKAPTPVHVKLNTGMNRRGFRSSEWPGVAQQLKETPNLQLRGLCTHLLEGEDLMNGREGLGYSLQQIETFEKTLLGFDKKNLFLHIYNSAGLASVFLNHQSMNYGCRPGLLTYGVDPMKDQRLAPLISPVMELHSNIVSTQDVKSGEVVSYGGLWRANRDSLIGIVPAGYADGVCRSLSNRGSFLVRGRRVPIVGRVCMDYTMVDLTDLNVTQDKVIGERAVIFGQQKDTNISVVQMAEAAERSTYEILTGVSERVPRLYLGA